MSAQTVLQKFRGLPGRVSHAWKCSEPAFIKRASVGIAYKYTSKACFRNTGWQFSLYPIPLNLILQVKINIPFIFTFVISADSAD